MDAQIIDGINADQLIYIEEHEEHCNIVSDVVFEDVVVHGPLIVEGKLNGHKLESVSSIYFSYIM